MAGNQKVAVGKLLAQQQHLARVEIRRCWLCQRLIRVVPQRKTAKFADRSIGSRPRTDDDYWL